MKPWKETILFPDNTIREAMKNIDNTGLQIALVIDSENRLKGIVTDGDIRRAILKGVSMEESVSSIMNTNPIKENSNTSDQDILALMRLKSISQIPIIDSEGKIIRLALLNELLTIEKKDNWVILMAGGLGTRLAPLTNDCPKPLLKIGDKPILENILNSFINYGFENFFISVNYKSHMIEEYFQDGSNWGVKIEYLREDKRLGTAGCLSLLSQKPEHPFFVMNGDLLTKINFLNMLSFHQEHDSFATMAVREYDFQVPFGVIDTHHQNIIALKEKPLYKFHVNAGIYLLEPSCLDLIPHNEYYDMPSLFDNLMKQEACSTVAFPIWEYWLDVGRMNDFRQANLEYQEIFG